VIIISRIAKAVSLERADSPSAPGLGRQKPIKPRRQRTGAWKAKTQNAFVENFFDQLAFTALVYSVCALVRGEHVLDAAWPVAHRSNDRCGRGAGLLSVEANRRVGPGLAARLMAAHGAPTPGGLEHLARIPPSVSQ
jgi:hypothetical protein